jgi:hypothetical protein
MGSGDGPNYEVYVELFYDDQNNVVTAMTLGNHMIVGIRKWGVYEVFNDTTDSHELGTVASQGVGIWTAAWEQRNNWFTDLGFSTMGKEDMEAVWKNYITNIGNNLKTSNAVVTVSDYADANSGKAYISLPPGTPNPWSKTLPPGFRQK